MNILMLHGSSDLYGASKVFLQTIDVLLSRHHKLIVCLSEPGPLSEEIQKRDVALVFMRLGILRRKYFTPAGIINRALVLIGAIIRLLRLSKQESVDLVYSNTSAVLAGAFMSWLARVPHIWHIHETIDKPAFFAKLLSLAVHYLSDTTIMVSQSVKNHWNSLYRNDTSRICVIYNGIETSPYARCNGQKVRKEIGVQENTVLIGMIARVHYWKGQIYFLNVAGEISKKFSNVQFLMAGDAFPGYEYLYDEISQTISQLGLTNIVHNLGYRSNVAEVMTAFDIFVLPSILPDPLPTTVLEAMASEKPVVATAHGGALEMVVNGKTGLHIPWNDPKKAFSIMEPLIESGELRKEMGTNGYLRARHYFSPYSFARNMTQVFDMFETPP
jgi:glycosyltransferase involved in cell wall biosynthesis